MCVCVCVCVSVRKIKYMLAKHNINVFNMSGHRFPYLGDPTHIQWLSNQTPYDWLINTEMITWGKEEKSLC